MESAETPPDEAYPWPEPIADESHRLSPSERLWAHFLITEEYKTVRRTLTTGTGTGTGSQDTDHDESPFVEISIGDSGDDWENLI